MAQQLNLCANVRPQTREGHTGPNAHQVLPFLDNGTGFWFADGRVISVPEATIPQYRGSGLGAKTRPNTFRKDCCTC